MFVDKFFHIVLKGSLYKNHCICNGIDNDELCYIYIYRRMLDLLVALGN